METKTCRKCLIEKPCNLFGRNNQNKDGLKSYCNDCRKIESKEYRERNPERRKETLTTYYLNNIDKEKLRLEKYKLENPEKRKQTIKKYYETNKKLINHKQVQRNRILYKTNYLYRIVHNLRLRTKNYLKLCSNNKNKTFEIIGCSKEFLKEHLEKQFTDGMSWENYGFYGWHIDHIIPLSSAKDEEEIYKLCHYTNLQPLWAFDNLSKGSKIDM